MMTKIISKNARRFRQLHQPGNPFVLANAWDIGSARLLAAAGAQALATTSAGHAFTLGKADMGNISRDEMMIHAAQMATATDLPVSGDCENGYGHSPDEVAETVRLAVAAGLAGCSIEDTNLPDDSPYSFTAAVARIESAVAAARAAADDFVITARADGMICGRYDLTEAVRRLRAYEKVGADVLYAPMPPDMAALEIICQRVTAPVNALVAGDFCRYTIADFARIGVARISLGSSLARVTHAAIQNAASVIFERGSFAPLSSAANGAAIDAALIQGAPQTKPSDKN